MTTLESKLAVLVDEFGDDDVLDIVRSAAALALDTAADYTESVEANALVSAPLRTDVGYDGSMVVRQSIDLNPVADAIRSLAASLRNADRGGG